MHPFMQVLHANSNAGVAQESKGLQNLGNTSHVCVKGLSCQLPGSATHGRGDK